MPTVKVGDIDLFYQDDDFADPWDKHETVFIQHGFGRNSNFFRGWVPWLARHYRVIRMDLRGHAGSGDPGPDYRFSAEGFLRDFIGFLDAMKIDKVHYIGESLGGLIGAMAAAQHPERFRSLTLISTPVSIPDNSARLALSLGYASWGECIMSIGMKQWWMTMRSSTGEITGDPAMDEHFATEFARTPAHIGAALTQLGPIINIAEYVPHIKVPTLLMVPGGGGKTPQEAQEAMVKSMPNGRMKVYPGAKHSMYHLIPDQLAQDAFEFIRGL